MSDIFAKILMGTIAAGVIGGELDSDKAMSKTIAEILGDNMENQCVHKKNHSHVTGRVKILIEKPEGDVPAKIGIEGRSCDLISAFSQAIGDFAKNVVPEKTLSRHIVRTICDGAIEHIERGSEEK